MPDDPRLLIAFCHAIEQSAANGFEVLDREKLLAIHGALMTLKVQIEETLVRLDEKEKRTKRMQ